MKKAYLFFIILVGTLFLSSCTREISEDPSVIVTTGDCNYISSEMTECSAFIQVIGNISNTEIIQRGFCYGSCPMPALENEGFRFQEGFTYVTKNGMGSGEFKAMLKDLPNFSDVYYRAYAITKKGVVYGKTEKLYVERDLVGSLTVNTAHIWSEPDHVDVIGEYNTGNWQVSDIDRCGFIYSDDPEFNSFERILTGWYPSSDNIILTGTLTGLLPSKEYYVKSFIYNDNMTLYSPTMTLHYGH